ncbi:hypothetical protein CR513_12407, partial [Mucuna pruriens]
MFLHVSPSLNALPIGMNNFLKEFQDVFPKNVPHKLPYMRGIEYQIYLTLRATLPNRAAYRANPKEAKEIQRKVGKLIKKGWVRECISPCAMPLILVPKNDGTWRICTDCRPINKITALIPYSDDLLNELHGSIIFSKIHLRNGYRQIRTKFGLYEWLVMPFGLTNAPNTLMK